MDDYTFDYLGDFRSMNPEFATNMANYGFVEWFKKMQDEPAIEDLDGADFSVRQETYTRMIKMWKNSQLSPAALSRLSPHILMAVGEKDDLCSNTIYALGLIVTGMLAYSSPTIRPRASPSDAGHMVHKSPTSEIHQ